MTRQLGRQPNRGRDRVSLRSDHMPATYTPPSTLDRFTAIPASAWGMDGNDAVGDCVSPETRVLTESLEWVSAASLVIGDRLLGFEEESRVGASGRKRGRWFSSALVERTDRVIRPVYELEFSDGTVVRSSAGHRWLTSSTVQGKLGVQSWERTEDLRPEAPRQTAVIKALDTWETDKSWHAGYLAAAFDGEGHLEQFRRANRVAFNQTGNAMLDQAELSLKELGFDYHHEVHSRNKLLRADGSPRKEMHTLRIGQRRDFLRFMGSIRPRRLLAQYDVSSLGRIPGDRVTLIRKTYLGEQPVILLDTSSRTYFAEGLASHNCTCADVHHEVLSMQAAAGNPLVQATTQEILAAYSAITGYNPADPSTDQGAEMQAVRDYWRKTGFTLGGHPDKILLFADVNIHDVTLVKWCLDQFGAIGLGVNFPSSAMDQFDSGQPWTVVHGSPIEGGHAVALVGYDESWWYVLTWGRVQKVAPTWFTEYVEEAWTALSVDFVNVHSGTDALGGTLHDLGAQFQNVTGQPNPVPAPSPAPTPGPAPKDADHAFADVLHHWVGERHIGENHTVQLAAQTWLAAKHL